jgi:hypothetical protein
MIGKVWKRFAAAFVAVAVVFSTVGHALEKGWEWVNVAQCSVSGAPGCWPAGTTVELCVNGLCIPGLDGATMPTAQYRMDMPVEPGDVIHGKARAVTPAGYQCGDPPVPCPYSNWSNNVVLTYPPPPSGFTYQLEKRNVMADPTYQGSGTLDYKGGGAASSLSTTITNVEVGDLLVVQLQRDNQNNITGVASTSPALTFNRQARAIGNAANNFNQDIYTAIATTAASSMVITASYSSSEAWGSMISFRWSGGITSGTATHTASDSDRRATSTSRTATNITTTARTLLLAAGSDWDYYRTHTAATNWTKILDSQTKGTDSTTMYLHARIADAGTYPSGNFATTSATDQYFGSIVALPVDTGAAAKSLPAHILNSARNYASILVR